MRLIEILQDLYVNKGTLMQGDQAVSAASIASSLNISQGEALDLINDAKEDVAAYKIIKWENALIELLEEKYGKLTITKTRDKLLINGKCASTIELSKMATEVMCFNRFGHSVKAETHNIFRIATDTILEILSRLEKIEPDEIDRFKNDAVGTETYDECVQKASELIKKNYVPEADSQAYDVVTTLIANVAASTCEEEDQVFFSPQRAIAILGRPGVGKTTLIQQLFGDAVYQSGRFSFSESNEGREAIKLDNKLAYLCDDINGDHENIEALKSYISKTRHTYRPCNANILSESRNTAQVIMTSNYREVIPNSPGCDRRFVVLASTLLKPNYSFTTADIAELRRLIALGAKRQIEDRRQCPPRTTSIEQYTLKDYQYSPEEYQTLYKGGREAIELVKHTPPAWACAKTRMKQRENYGGEFIIRNDTPIPAIHPDTFKPVNK